MHKMHKVDLQRRANLQNINMLDSNGMKSDNWQA